MNQPEHIDIELIKLANGVRLLRLADRNSGLSLEKKLDPAKPVVRQKQQLRTVFESVLTQARLASA
jgi:hypothetical protein